MDAAASTKANARSSAAQKETTKEDGMAKAKVTIRHAQLDILQQEVDKVYSGSWFGPFLWYSLLTYVGWTLLPIVLAMSVWGRFAHAPDDHPLFDPQAKSCMVLSLYVSMSLGLLWLYSWKWEDSPEYKPGYYNALLSSVWIPLAQAASRAIYDASGPTTDDTKAMWRVRSKEEFGKQESRRITGSVRQAAPRDPEVEELNSEMEFKAWGFEDVDVPVDDDKETGQRATYALKELLTKESILHLLRKLKPRDSLEKWEKKVEWSPQLSIGLEEAAQSSGLCIWGCAGQRSVQLPLRDPVDLAPKDDYLLLFSPITEHAARCYAFNIYHKKPMLADCARVLARMLSLFVFAIVLLAGSYSHSLLPQIYKKVTTGQWSCVYPRVCGIPCSAEPLPLSGECEIPFGAAAGTSVPQYPLWQAPNGVRNSSSQTSNSSKTALDGFWTTGSRSKASTPWALLGQHVPPCRIRLHGGRLHWFGASPHGITMLENTTDGCSDLLAEARAADFKCTGSGFSVEKPVYRDPLQCDKGNGGACHVTVTAYLLKDKDDQELLAWQRERRAEESCDTDTISRDGLCVWERSQVQAWAPATIDSNASAIGLSSMFSPSCNGPWVMNFEKFAYISYECSALLYGSTVALSWYIVIFLGTQARAMKKLNDLLTLYRLHDVSQGGKQASFTYHLWAVRRSVARICNKYPELELDIFPVVHEGAGPVELGWWLNTRTALLLQIHFFYSAALPVVVFMAFMASCVMFVTVWQSVLDKDLKQPLALYALFDGGCFGGAVLALVVIGARINSLCDKGLETARAMASGSPGLETVFTYIDENPFYLGLLGFKFNTVLLATYASSFSAYVAAICVTFGQEYIMPWLKELA